MKMAKGHRGSVIDVVLIFLLIALASSACLRLIDRHAESNKAQAASATLVLAVSALPSRVADCLFVGDTLYLPDGTPLGTLEAIEKHPARIMLENNGTFLIGSLEDTQCDLQLRVRVEGTFNGRTFFVDGRVAFPLGKAFTAYTDLAAVYATLIAAESNAEKGL